MRFAGQVLQRAAAQRVALVLLGLLVIGAPQLFGGVFSWSIRVIAICAQLALLAAWWATRGNTAARTPWLTLVICLSAVWTAVQAAPLPCGLIQQVAPESAQALRAALAALGSAPPTFCTLSRDPGATQEEVLKGVAIVSGFLAAWLLCMSGARRQVLWLVACSTLAMSVVALLHAAFELDQVFGVYKPIQTGRVILLAPLMNPNNLGGFAAMGAPLWIGIVARERTSLLRLIGAVGIALTSTTALLSLSRGAIAVLVGSIAFIVLFAIIRKRVDADHSSTDRARRALVVGAAVAAGLGLTAYATAELILQEFTGGDMEKINLISIALRFASAHPVIGVGRGAFSSTFVGAEGDLVRYVYPENFLAQWASEWGFPITVALVAAIAHALWLSLSAYTSMRRIGAAVALLALATQNLVDIGLELVGVAVVAAVLLASIVAPSRRAAPAGTVTRPRARSLALGAAVSCALATLLLTPGLQASDASNAEAALREHLADGNRKAFHRTLVRALPLHPSEPTFAVLAAAESLAHGDPAAARWINRGMLLAPHWPAPHFQAFQWLWAAGRHDQALLELRATAEISPAAAAPAICPLARANTALVLRAAPQKLGKTRATFLEMAAGCLAWDSPTTEALDQVALRDFPNEPRPKERQALRLGRTGQLDAALALLDGALAHDPKDARTQTVRAQLLLEAKRFGDSVASAQHAGTLVAEAELSPLLSIQATAQAALADDAALQATLGELRRVAGGDSARLANTYALEGGLQAGRRRFGEAFRAYKEAYRINPESSYLQQAAGLAEALGDRGQALWVYMQLCESGPGQAAYCAKRDHFLNAAKALNLKDGQRN